MDHFAPKVDERQIIEQSSHTPRIRLDAVKGTFLSLTDESVCSSRRISSPRRTDRIFPFAGAPLAPSTPHFTLGLCSREQPSGALMKSHQIICSKHLASQNRRLKGRSSGHAHSSSRGSGHGDKTQYVVAFAGG